MIFLIIGMQLLRIDVCMNTLFELAIQLIPAQIGMNARKTAHIAITK